MLFPASLPSESPRLSRRRCVTARPTWGFFAWLSADPTAQWPRLCSQPEGQQQSEEQPAAHGRQIPLLMKGLLTGTGESDSSPRSMLLRGYTSKALKSNSHSRTFTCRENGKSPPAQPPLQQPGGHGAAALGRNTEGKAFRAAQGSSASGQAARKGARAGLKVPLSNQALRSEDRGSNTHLS